MKKFIVGTIIAFLCCLLSYEVVSQNPPCKPDEQNLTVMFPRLSAFPTYITGMPYDVLIGYIVLDTVSHYVTRYDFMKFIKRQTYNDTLHHMMKYYYKMADYDPPLFNRSFEFRDNRMTTSPVHIEDEFIEKIAEVSPTPYLDRALLEHQYILHIFVTDTLFREIPDYPGAASEVYNITAEVLDTIKGKVLPGCKSLDLVNQSSVSSVQDFPNSCIQFAYSPAWGFWRGKIMQRIEDENGDAWVKKGKEYIVFLDLSLICGTATDVYYTLSPLGLPYKSHTFLMFPIENGHVIDPGNEFGFGTNLTVEQWKTALRNHIYSITN